LSSSSCSSAPTISNTPSAGREPKTPAPRRIYPAESDPAALRVDISPTGISTPPDVAIVAIDDPKSGAERERPVRIVMSPAQAAALVRRLQGVLAEIDIP